MGNKGPCSALFSKEHYRTMSADAAALSWNELNMVLIGQVMALSAVASRKQVTVFQHHRHRVCSKTFLFLHGIGKRKFKLIKAYFTSSGLTPRMHGNTGRSPANTLIMEEVRNVVIFVTQHAEANAILLQGRIPGYKRSDIQIFLSSTTKRAIWLLYEDTAQQLSQRRIAYSTFTNVWRNFLPHVVVARPMTHLCATCQKNSAVIIRGVNLSEEGKSEVNHHYKKFHNVLLFLSKALKTAEEHFMRATSSIALWSKRAEMAFVSTSLQPTMKLSSAANNAALSSTTNNAALSSLPSTASPPPPSLLQAHVYNQVPDLLVCITLLISPSRSTTLITFSNLALCTSGRQESVPFLVYAVRACPARLLMRRQTLVRERTL